jgi:hypothetical protein
MKKVKLSPSDLFKTLNVKDEEEALKVFEATLNFLLFIEVGEEIRIPSTTIKKISHDKLAISQTVSDRDTMLKLLHKRIIEVEL